MRESQGKIAVCGAAVFSPSHRKEESLCISSHTVKEEKTTFFCHRETRTRLQNGSHTRLARVRNTFLSWHVCSRERANVYPRQTSILGEASCLEICTLHVRTKCVRTIRPKKHTLTFFCAGYEDEEMAALNWAVSHIGRKLRKRRYFLRLFLSLQHTDKEKEKVKSLRNQIERNVLCSHDICHPAPIEKKRAETSSSDAVIIIIVGGKNRTIDFLPQRQHSSLFPPAFMRNSAKSALEQKKKLPPSISSFHSESSEAAYAKEVANPGTEKERIP